MLTKLAMSGLKNRFRDYAVLFSGLVIASAIFYMFMALATNQDFVKANSTVAAAPFVFGFGAVLLAIITLVYIIYANTFLMSMRQRDYAMFIMLGAKSSKIGQLIFIETVLVGSLATVVGTVFGVGLTAITGRLLINQLHATVKHFSAFWLPALLITFIFFIILFVIAAVMNQSRLLKTPVLQLLHADQTPNRTRQKKPMLIAQIVSAIVLLGIGYWSMKAIVQLQLLSIPIALVTIVLGTYFLFNSVFVWLISLLKRNRNFAGKGIRAFTLAQLSFRIRDYTKILSVVSILFALALGAITVGIGFRNQISLFASYGSQYDVVLHSPSAATQQKAKQLTDVTSTVTYQQKHDSKNIYYLTSEFEAHPLLAKASSNIASTKVTKITPSTYKEYSPSASALQELAPFKQRDLAVKFVSASAFAAIPGTTSTATMYRVKSFDDNYQAIAALVKADRKAQGMGEQAYGLSGKFDSYEVANALFSGMEFMGFFLGIAFLAMLASTLMFKILSGAAYDQVRYLMLQKIGTRPSVLKHSIRQEIGALFLLPGIVGVVHVLFGLQLFKALMVNPYANLWLPFGIFIVLYGIYYFLTVWLYQGIVIDKELN